MGNIRIERVPIQTLNLGWFRADHLQLVYQQDPLDYGYYQDRWWVIEGSFAANAGGSIIGVIGGDGTTTLSDANGGKSAQELLDAIHFPWWRGSRILTTGDAFNDWMTMAAIGRNIDQQELPYFAYAIDSANLPTANSSSVIASLLFYIGVDIAENMPSSFLRFTTGAETLLGTTEDDEIELVWSFDTILGGAGKDTLTGTNAPDRTEKLYGGIDDDILLWSDGPNVLHGGQPQLAYEEDGTDLLDYSGIGEVTLELSQYAMPHLVPDIVARHDGGIDRIFSIERLRWNPESDNIILGDGLDVLVDKHFIIGGEEAADGAGDRIDFSDQQSSILLRATDVDGIAFASTLSGSASARENGGLWLESIEWLAGSAGDDRLYAPETLRGLEGGAGNDHIDGRSALAFAGGSPLGYDIELSGGEGNDTLVSGAGRTYAAGGDGADTFVLSALSNGMENVVEFVIADAGADDRVLVPYNFLKPIAGTLEQSAVFEGSALFPVLGGLSAVAGFASFADLPQNPAPGPGGATGPGSGAPFTFEWQSQNDYLFGADPSLGVIDMAGAIYFNRDGDDLLIHVYAGVEFEDTYIGRDEQEHTGLFIINLLNTETVIRVVDFVEGMLGIHFYDRGEASFIDFEDEEGPGTAVAYAGWDAAVAALTNGGQFIAPLETAPDAVVYDAPDQSAERSRTILIGSATNDVIDAEPPAAVNEPPPLPVDRGADIRGDGGDDELSGTFRSDRIDGGTGADVMTGRSGDDLYLVDDGADIIIETQGGGLDSVVASVSATLADHVERLTLTGAAVSGTGNAGDNRIAGNAVANALFGMAGSDTLAGYGGDDLLDGGEGNDGYVIGAGDGFDRIRDAGAVTDIDTLILTDAVADEVTVIRTFAAPDDVVIRLADGGRVVLEDFLIGASIELVVFQDGSGWSRAEVLARAIAAPIAETEAPVAASDGDFIAYQSTITLPADVLLANDRDPEGQMLSIVAARSATNGVSAEVLTDGSVRVSAVPGFLGSAQLYYTISDGEGGIDEASIELGFIPNAAPVLAMPPIADLEAAAGDPIALTLPAGLFVDPDGHSLVYTARVEGGGALPAWLLYDADTRTFSGTVPDDFSGVLTVEIVASDSEAAGSTSFDIVVASAGVPPVAVNDSGIEATRNVALVIDPQSLIANDTDADGDPLSIVSVTAISGGSVVLAPTGEIVFTPDADYLGPAQFGYEISDGADGTSTAVVSLEVGWGPIGPVTHQGTAGADTITGTARANVIDGGAGNDVLTGRGGDDIFLATGDAGFDQYGGGLGFDRVQGSSANDVIGVTALLRAFAGIEAIDGGAGFDILRLADSGLRLNLDGVIVRGIERIEGGLGQDTITGSRGDDVIAGGGARDRFIFEGAFGRDTLIDFAPRTLNGAESDRIDLSAFGLLSFNDVRALAVADGADVVLSLASSSIRLSNVSINDLTAFDFVL
ncbi:MAG: cadherin-like domain-containing protein [Hyphomicrobium sp.]|nr:cadherin-like domain-containing protein [Hyphomicrobium sp.]